MDARQDNSPVKELLCECRSPSEKLDAPEEKKPIIRFLGDPLAVPSPPSPLGRPLAPPPPFPNVPYGYAFPATSHPVDDAKDS